MPLKGDLNTRGLMTRDPVTGESLTHAKITENDPSLHHGGMPSASNYESKELAETLQRSESIDRSRKLMKRVPQKDSRWQGGSHKEVGFIARISKTGMNIYNFQFNPTTLSGSESGTWVITNTPGSAKGIGSFMHTNPGDIRLSLFFDATDRIGTWNKKQRVIGQKFLGVWADILGAVLLVQPDYTTDIVEEQGNISVPTPVIFCMGPVIDKYVITEVRWRITQWFTDLIPSRAELDIPLKSIGTSRKSDIQTARAIQQAVLNSRFLKQDEFYSKYSSYGSLVELFGEDNLFVNSGSVIA